MPYRTPRDPRRRLELAPVPTACSSRWDEMVGSDACRLCLRCKTTVYDLAALDPADLALEDGDRVYQRADGLVLMDECAPAARRRHAWHATQLIGATFAAVVLLAIALHAATVPRLANEEPELRAPESLVVARDEVVVDARYDDLDADACFTENTYLDDATLALAAEPESEVLGTSARTERVAYEYRMRSSVVLPGTIRLVTARR